jgi:hypothetical protein
MSSIVGEGTPESVAAMIILYATFSSVVCNKVRKSEQVTTVVPGLIPSSSTAGRFFDLLEYRMMQLYRSI